MTNTWLKREEMRKVTFRMGEVVRGADFVLIYTICMNRYV